MLFDPLDLKTYALQYTEKYQTKNSLIGALGDSRLANAGKDGTSENIGPLHWACMLSGQRLSFQTRYNFGVGGYSTQDIIDNTLKPACESEPSNFFVLCGTNDRVLYPAAQSIANIETIVSSLLAAGKVVYILAEMPRGSIAFSPTYTLSASQLIDHLAVRDYILSLRGRKNVFVSDCWKDICLRTSTTGEIISTASLDGLHPNTNGAYLVGKNVAEQIVAANPIAPAATPVNNTSGNIWLNTNPILDGTGGSSFGTGGSGAMATGYSGSTGSTVGGITRVYSKTAEGYQQVVIGGTAASGSNPQLDLLRQTGLQTSITTGKSVYAAGEFSLAAGQANLTSLQLGIMVTKADASVQYVWDGEVYNSTSPMPSATISGVWQTEPIVVPDGATDVRLMVRSYGTTSSACSGTVIIKSLGIRYA